MPARARWASARHALAIRLIDVIISADQACLGHAWSVLVNALVWSVPNQDVRLQARKFSLPRVMVKESDREIYSTSLTYEERCNFLSSANHLMAVM